MDIVDELERLSDLHRDGQLTDDEFDAAKAALLTRQARGASPAADIDAATPIDPDAASIRRNLDELRRQQARLQLDQDWERERDAHMLDYDSHTPHRRIPTRAGGVWTAVVGVVGGIAFLVFTGSAMREWSSASMGMTRAKPPARVTIVDAQGKTIDVVDGADLDLPLGLGGAPDDGLWGAFPLAGLVFAALGIWAGVWHYRRAVAYETAEQAYRARRARLDGASAEGAGGADDSA